MFQNKAELTKTAFFWDILLGTYSPMLPHPSFNEINKVQVDLPQYRTLKMDIPRTRSQLISPQMHGVLEKLIVYFCQQEKISYKQGMNEIFAVIAVFNECGLQWEKIYEYARKIIIDNNFFKDEEFLSLQVAFQWINLLLKFHDFELFDHLDKQYLSPELYATPWLLTLFANKMSLECIYLLWEMLYIKKDQLMIYFIVVAVLIEYRQLLLTTDYSLLPQTLTGIYIESIDIIKKIYKKAVDLKLNTPITSCIQQKIFDLPKQQLEILLEQIQQQQCLTIQYQESHKLITNFCRLCQNKGCVQCRIIRMPQEMKHFIYSNQNLLELVQYIGNSVKQYQLVDQIINNCQNIQIIKYNKTQQDQIINNSYICYQLQQQSQQNTEEDTISTRSQNSLFNSQIIVPFKFNKLLLQQQIQKQPDDQYESIQSSESSSRQQQSISCRQSSIIEKNILQNIRLNNLSPIEIQPLILKKDSRANSLKTDPIKRYENKGLIKKIIIDINQIGNNKYYIFKCKLNNTPKPRILLLNSCFICLIKDEKMIYQKLQQQQQQKQKLQFKTEQQQQIQIQYLYYFIFLKRISSKRQNSNVISFYFRQPIVNSQQSINNGFFNLFKEYHSNVDYEYINESKKMIKTEWKITLEMQTTQEAQNCIEIGKQCYKQCQF